MFSKGANLSGGSGWETFSSRGDSARKQRIAIRSNPGPGRVGTDFFSIRPLPLTWRLVAATDPSVTAALESCMAFNKKKNSVSRNLSISRGLIEAASLRFIAKSGNAQLSVLTNDTLKQ